MHITNEREERKRQFGNALLMQIIWLLLFVGFGCYLLAPSISTTPDFSPNAHAAIEVHNLAQAVEAFRIEIGCYPPDFSGSDSQDQEQIHQVLLGLEFRSESDQITPSSLDPAEALVFWLGGFRRNSTKPLTGSNKRPFFEFDQSRLVDQDGDGFEEYYPIGLKTPFVYLHPAPTEVEFVDNELPAKKQVLNGSIEIRPYRFEPGSNKKSVAIQIICAGRDDDFGSGGLFPDGIGYSEADEDNLASFSDGLTLQDRIP